MAGSDVVEAMRLALKPFNIDFQHLADDWNANRTYLQLSVQRCQHPPAAERCCWGGVGHDFRCAGGGSGTEQCAAALGPQPSLCSVKRSDLDRLQGAGGA